MYMAEPGEKEPIAAFIKKELEGQPEELQGAFDWVVHHFAFVKEVCRDSGLTDEELEAYKRRAAATGDGTLFVFCCAAQVWKEEKQAL